MMEKEKDGGMIFVVGVAVGGVVNEALGSGFVVTVVPVCGRVVCIVPGPIEVVIVVGDSATVGEVDGVEEGVPFAPPGRTGFSVKLVKARTAMSTSKITVTIAMLIFLGIRAMILLCFFFHHIDS
jgi:hypothetical protein